MSLETGSSRVEAPRTDAHNDEAAVALCERAADALACPPGRRMRLDGDDIVLRAVILEAAEKNNLIFEEP